VATVLEGDHQPHPRRVFGIPFVDRAQQLLNAVAHLVPDQRTGTEQLRTGAIGRTASGIALGAVKCASLAEQ